MAPNISWKAVYSDGTFLFQHNEDGTENKYYDIDRKKLIAFEVYKDKNLILLRHLEPGQRLIFRQRCAFSTKGDEIRVFLVGWQQTINGKNIQEIAYVFPTHVELAGRWDTNLLGNSPKLTVAEKESD